MPTNVQISDIFVVLTYNKLLRELEVRTNGTNEDVVSICELALEKKSIDDMEETILDKPFPFSMLSTRSYNSFYYNGYSIGIDIATATYRDMTMQQSHSLLKMRNFGKQCVFEIEAILKREGLFLGMNLNEK
jgi:DNA-directed RNA polymerase alpha subunit